MIPAVFLVKSHEIFICDGKLSSLLRSRLLACQATLTNWANEGNEKKHG